MSLADRLASATTREVLAHPDGKSGVLFERVELDGETYVIKHLHADDDWIMRASGDLRCRPLLLWRSGLLDRLPACFDHAIVDVSDGLGRNGWGAAIVMRDVASTLVPEGHDPLPVEQEARFLDHMAELHASFWGWTDDIGLAPLVCRYTYFTRHLPEVEDALGSAAAVPPITRKGWELLPEVAPEIADDVLALREAPWPMIDALAALPVTFLHGDWKLGNLGSHEDGRTVLLDWATPGSGPCVAELAWWLSVNTRRLPSGKDANIAMYRDALERRGIDTGPWWDRAIDLALLGAMVQFAWEKALDGPGAELDWWVRAARAGLARL